MSALRIAKQVTDTTHRQADGAPSNQQDVKTCQRNVSQAAPSPAEGSLRPEFKGPQKPKGNVNEDFDLSHVPHSNRQFLELFREILVSLKLVPSRGVNPLAWRMSKEINRTLHSDNVSQMTDAANLLAIQSTGKLAKASAVHIMSRDGFILDSATKLDDGTWVFSKGRDGYHKNSLILFQTEVGGGQVKNESLPLKLLKAR